MHFQTFSLPEGAAELVKYGWYMEAEEPQVQPYPDLLIPDACPEIIFVLEGAYEKIELQAPHTHQVIEESNIIGISTGSHLIRRRGRIRLLGLKFNPLGFYQLFPDQVHAFLNQNIPIEHHSSPWLQTLDLELKSASGLSHQFEVLSTILMQRTQPFHKREAFHLTQSLLKHILVEKGDIQVKTLAQTHHRSIRQIQRYFKQFVGVSPKQFAQIIRFKAFYKESLLQASGTSFWDYGYYDQNHFIQDFRTKLGALPSETNAPYFRQKHEIAQQSLR